MSLTRGALIKKELGEIEILIQQIEQQYPNNSNAAALVGAS
jgi:hypothetical protein